MKPKDRPVELPAEVYGELGIKRKNEPIMHGSAGCSSTADGVRTLWFILPYAKKSESSTKRR